jgi:hypothetical protein
MAKKQKAFTQYIRSGKTGIGGYMKHPAVAFFKEIVDISDASAHCNRHFPKKKNVEFTAASDHSYTQINAGLLCTLMGHFELYQRFTYAGLVEYSVEMEGLEIKDVINRLDKDFSLQIDPMKMLSYRRSYSAAGLMIVDNLPGWHDPSKVNKYFKAFRPKLNFYSNDQIKDIRVLWQLRHTMAHTGGWLSVPDAEKNEELKRHRNRDLYLSPNFIETVARRFHRIVFDCTTRLKVAVEQDASEAFKKSDAFKNYFEITSPRKSWLPTP